jgi:hypothetical protein
MKTPNGFKEPNSLLGFDSLKVDCLHPFGCLFWYKVPEANRKKLDPKARQAILLLYLSDGNGYCLWDLFSKNIVKSRDVLFSNDNFPYKCQPSTAVSGQNPVIVELPWPERNPSPVPIIPVLTPRDPTLSIQSDRSETHIPLDSPLVGADSPAQPLLTPSHLPLSLTPSSSSPSCLP